MLNKRERKAMTCDICGESGAQVRYMTRSYGKGAKLLVIEDVPVVVCPHCGESYLTAETLHEIERIKMHRRSLAKPRNVAVATFAQLRPPDRDFRRLVDAERQKVLGAGWLPPSLLDGSAARM